MITNYRGFRASGATPIDFITLTLYFIRYIFWRRPGTFTTRRWYIGTDCKTSPGNRTINALLMVEKPRTSSAYAAAKRSGRRMHGPSCAPATTIPSTADGRTSAYVSKDGKSVLIDIGHGAKTHHVVLAARPTVSGSRASALFDQTSARPAASRPWVLPAREERRLERPEWESGYGKAAHWGSHRSRSPLGSATTSFFNFVTLLVWHLHFSFSILSATTTKANSITSSTKHNATGNTLRP